MKMDVKVAPERQNVKRIWNVSDWPGKKMVAQTMMVMGKRLAPGRGMKVPADRMVRAHKLNRVVESGLLYVGTQLPEAYLRAKGPIRVRQTAARAHAPKVVGKPAAKPVAKAAPPKAAKPKRAKPAAPKAEEPKKDASK